LLLYHFFLLEPMLVIRSIFVDPVHLAHLPLLLGLVNRVLVVISMSGLFLVELLELAFVLPFPLYLFSGVLGE
jgi:hypothetical protein